MLLLLGWKERPYPWKTTVWIRECEEKREENVCLTSVNSTELLGVYHRRKYHDTAEACCRYMYSAKKVAEKNFMMALGLKVRTIVFHRKQMVELEEQEPQLEVQVPTQDNILEASFSITHTSKLDLPLMTTVSSR